jgi:protein-S-isoprenylcysteine O-methyltransferase Ste14
MNGLDPTTLASAMLESAWISARIAAAAGLAIWIAGAALGHGRPRAHDTPPAAALPGAGPRALAQLAALLAGGALCALTRGEAAGLPGWAQALICILAAICALLGGMLGAWSARTLGAQLVLPAEVRAGAPLVTSGPFAIVRHPFYLSLVLWALGAGLALGSLFGTVGLVAALLATSAARARLEDRVLEQAHGDAFRAYAAKVPAFFPKI